LFSLHRGVEAEVNVEAVVALLRVLLPAQVLRQPQEDRLRLPLPDREEESEAVRARVAPHPWTSRDIGFH
jgi:hypothetical protein